MVTATTTILALSWNIFDDETVQYYSGSLQFPALKINRLIAPQHVVRRKGSPWMQQELTKSWRTCKFISRLSYSFIHSFIHSDHFYSATWSPLLLRSAPDTARILCRSFTLKRHRQLWVKDLPKVPIYLAARAGVEPMTLRLKAIDSTNAPPGPTRHKQAAIVSGPLFFSIHYTKVCVGRRMIIAVHYVNSYYDLRTIAVYYINKWTLWFIDHWCCINSCCGLNNVPSKLQARARRSWDESTPENFEHT